MIMNEYKKLESNEMAIERRKADRMMKKKLENPDKERS